MKTPKTMQEKIGMVEVNENKVVSAPMPTVAQKYVRSEPHVMKTFGKVESGEITDCSVVSRGRGGANRSGHAGWN